MSTPRIFNEQFKNDFKAIISLSTEDIEKVASLFSENKSINPFKSGDYVSFPLTRLIPLLIFVFSEYSGRLNELYRNLNFSGVTEEEVSKFKDILSIFVNRGLSDWLIKLSKSQDAERFGYSILDYVEMMADYRFRYNRNGEKILFPVPIYKIVFTDRNENPLIFQSSVSQLDDLIMSLQNFRKSLESDLTLLKDKKLAEGY